MWDRRRRQKLNESTFVRIHCKILGLRFTIRENLISVGQLVKREVRKLFAVNSVPQQKLRSKLLCLQEAAAEAVSCVGLINLTVIDCSTINVTAALLV